MSTISDVQNAMVNVITPALYPNSTSQPSIVNSILSSVAVDAGGSAYTTATVSFSGGGGTGAIAEAVISGGEIIAVNLVDPGTDYTAPPTVTITGDGSGAAATAALTPRIIYVYPGDPLKQNLDGDLAAGNINVSVFAQKGMTRNTTRVRDQYASPIIDAATLVFTILNDTVTITGTVTVGQTAVIIVNGVGYAYQAQIGDTVDSIAATLANAIPGASSFNNKITIPSAITLVARASVPGTMRRILQSEEAIFRVRIIAPTFDTREAVSSAIQLAFLTLEPRYYLQMPDGISASIRAKGIEEVNAYELALGLCRDYLYLIEYHVVDVQTFQTIADPSLTIADNFLPPD